MQGATSANLDTLREVDPSIIGTPALWARDTPMGLVSLALFVGLFVLLTHHRGERRDMRKEADDERREMRREADQRMEQMLTVQRETNQAINAVTACLQEMNARRRHYDQAEPQRSRKRA